MCLMGMGSLTCPLIQALLSPLFGLLETACCNALRINRSAFSAENDRVTTRAVAASKVSPTIYCHLSVVGSFCLPACLPVCLLSFVAVFLSFACFFSFSADTLQQLGTFSILPKGCCLSYALLTSCPVQSAAQRTKMLKKLFGLNNNNGNL